MLAPGGQAMTLLLGALVASAPLAMDIYLPSMPAMTRALGATAGEVQLTLSVYMFGWGAAQLFAGPLSDRYGRRPALIAGLAALCEQAGASSVHVTFAQSGDLAALREAGYLERHDLQFHWLNEGFTDYDGFLATLASRKRKALKRERRA